MKSIKIFFKSFSVKDSLSQRLLLLTLGFGATYFLGNWITGEFQKRQFDYQYSAQLQESELKAATKVFEDVSRLTDKRVYRMEKLNWELKDNKDQVKIDSLMNVYRDILYDWNDNRNRNFALMHRYFGEGVASYYDNDIHSAIKDTGKLLENYYYTPRLKRKEDVGWEIDGRLGDLENKSRELNIRMLKLIKENSESLLKGKK